MEKIKREEGRDVDWVGLLLDKQDEIVDEINTCYSILLKVQDWIVKHEKHSQKR